MWQYPTKQTPIEGELYRFCVRPARNITLPEEEHIGQFISPNGNAQFICSDTGTPYYWGSNLNTITRFSLLVPHL